MEPSRGPIVHRLPCASSTQRVARDYVELGAARAGHVVIADAQSAGIGRHGRTWLSPSGGLYATFVVPYDRLIAVRAGVAVARAIEGLSVAVKLKWPNDLVVVAKKLGGILIETLGGLALVGVGINVDSSPLPEATSLRELKVDCDRSALMHLIYCGLVGPEADDQLLAAYRARLSTLGQAVRVDRGEGDTLLGTAVDIDASGHLLLETSQGRVTVASADCLHLLVAASRDAAASGTFL